MSRRAGQDGSEPYKEGGFWKTRIWIDVQGQDKRAHPSIRICPIKGPGSLNLSQRKARVRELIAESGANSKKRFDEVVKPQGTVTFGEQAKIMLEQMRTRNREPVTKGTLENYERSFRLHLYPVLEGIPLSQIYNPELKLVAQALVKKGRAATTITGHITIAKSVVSSVIDERTGEPLYPRTWNAEVIDLPIIDPDEMNTPSFSRETLTGIVAYYDEPRLRTLFTLLAAAGPRIAESLGLEIDKHFSPDFRTYEALRSLLPRAILSPRKAKLHTHPILMCFSHLAGLWHCSFFRDDSRKVRLPRKLKFRDSAKIHLAAERGNAELDSSGVRQELEHAIKSGYGKIWLRLSDEQITTLESGA